MKVNFFLVFVSFLLTLSQMNYVLYINGHESSHRKNFGKNKTLPISVLQLFILDCGLDDFPFNLPYKMVIT